MEFRILGPLEVLADGTSLPLGGPRQRALLSLLLLRANEAVSSERLLDELWGDELPASGSTAVQNQVARLRKVIGADRIETRSDGYAVHVEPGELDLDRFRELVTAAESEDAARRSELLAEAVGLWRGAALQGLPEAPFVAPESARLEGLRLAALEDRIDADLELGRHADLVAELSALAARYPLQERLRAQLMLALYRSGRQAEALDVYRETRRMLADELGLEPSPALRDLERAILEHDPALDPPVKAARRARATTAVPPPAGRRTPRVVLAALALLALGAAGATAAVLLSRSPAVVSAAATTAVRTTSLTTTTQHVATHHGTTRPVTTTRGTTTAPATRPRVTTSATTARIATTPAASTRAVTVTTTHPAVTVAHATTEARTTAPRTTAPATTAPKKTTTEAPKPKQELKRIADDFSAPEVDAATWRVFTDGTGASVAEQGGQLSVTIGADGQAGGPDTAVGGRVATVCTFPDDFDARVDFTLFTWPPADNVRAGLSALFADGFVGRRTTADGEEYAASVGPHVASVALDETSGSLRIARVGDVMTTYYWRNGRWVPLASGRSSGAAVLSVGLTAGRDFGTQEARGAFDDFAVSARNTFCPG